MNQTTTNLEMLTVAVTCSGASTDNQCITCVTVNFEFVGIRSSLGMFSTRLCLSDSGTKTSRSGITEKLFIVQKLVDMRTTLADDV